ncbi:hypothetical protein [Castellaniella sp. S9]|uniref:hypothetical protein n=1 Tax=Castellaniella sp. S9 TaxID=2993652 RepID=UPI0022B34FFB|nr:hypothetical protein [Castellaniella sp. S9]
MANLTETAKWESGIYRIETDDPVLGGENGVSNAPIKQLANRTVYLKQYTDQVANALDGHPDLGARLQQMQEETDSLGPDMQNAVAAALKFALTQVGVNAWGLRALREQAQQEGQIEIENRGVVSGCTVTRSTTAARNLNLSDGACFAKGRAYSVTPGNNAASVPSNTGAGPVVVYAYLYQNATGLWRLAVTAIGQAVPAGAITIYRLTVPANSTDATDPNLENVTITDVRRIERQWPQVFDSPATVSAVLNVLRSSDYRLDFDIVSAVGAPCGHDDIVVSSRATNGFSVQLASPADSVVVRWRASKLNN